MAGEGSLGVECRPGTTLYVRARSSQIFILIILITSPLIYPC